MSWRGPADLCYKNRSEYELSCEHDVRILRSDRFQQTVRCIWQIAPTEKRIAGCIWITNRPQIWTRRLQPLPRCERINRNVRSGRSQQNERGIWSTALCEIRVVGYVRIRGWLQYVTLQRPSCIYCPINFCRASPCFSWWASENPDLKIQPVPIGVI
jgi:hypothetical protein